MTTRKFAQRRRCWRPAWRKESLLRSDEGVPGVRCLVVRIIPPDRTHQAPTTRRQTLFPGRSLYAFISQRRTVDRRNVFAPFARRVGTRGAADRFQMLAAGWQSDGVARAPTPTRTAATVSAARR